MASKRPTKARKTTAKSRAPASTGAPERRRLAQVAMLGAAFACLYATVALASYDPFDPSFTRSGSGAVSNLAGPLGAWVADLMLQVLGYGAWMVTALGVACALRLAGRLSGGLLRVVAWSLIGWALLAVLAMLLPVEASDPYPAGGVLGMVSAEWLSALFGPAGAWIVAGGVVLAAAPFVTALDWSQVAARGVSGAEALLPRVGAIGAAAGRRGMSGVRGGLDSLREAFEARREPWDDESADQDDDLSEASEDPISLDDPGWDRSSTSDAASVADTPSASVPPGDLPRLAIPIGAEPALGPLPRATQVAAQYSDMGRPTVPSSPAARTQVAQRELVEVEWDPSEVSGRWPSEAESARRMPIPVDAVGRPAAEEPSAAELPLVVDTTPRPTRWEDRGSSGTAATEAPSDAGDPLDAPDPGSLSPRSSAVVVEEDEPGSVWEEDDGETAPPRPAASRNPAAASPSVRRLVRPGDLSSGGGDDGGLARVDIAENTPFELPHLGLLDTHDREVGRFDEGELQALARTLEQKLADFGVLGEVTAIRPGPVVTTFEYLPAPGIKISKISNLSDDIAMALRALRVRIVAPIPGKGVVGIEIPNKERQTVWIRDILASEGFRKGSSALPIALGKSVEGHPRIADLGTMPHLLVGGTTGSGKSVGVNAMLLSMLFTRTPEELRFIMIDPKMLEFELYRDIPHLLHPVVTEPKLASAALKWACTEMDERYRVLSRWKTRNISSYNRKIERELEDWNEEKARRYAPEDWPEHEPLPVPHKMPYIVIVIDELSDLMMVAAKDVEASIIRIAQKARAAGIHLIVATQRPSVNVITGLIKANMPSRIAFQVRTKVDGRTILDQNGAENLLGKGDMLYLPPGVSALERVHGPFVSDDEVRRVTDFLRAQGEPCYDAQIVADDGELPELSDDDYDEFYDHAVSFVISKGKASASMIQRQFKIGYNRASRIIDIMEREGVVGEADGARPRDVLVGRQTG